MKKNLNISLIIIFIAMIVLSLSGCKNDDTSGIGLNVVGDNPFNVSVIDTVSIVSYTLSYDSVVTSNIKGNRGNLVGSIYDATFGKTTANLALSFASTKGALKDSLNPLTVDSVVLTMAYSSLYGDPNTQQNFRIYELDEYIDTISYYSNYVPNHKNEELGCVAFNPIDNGDTTTTGLIRVNLDNSFGQKIIDLPTSVLNDNNAFIEVFNGIYVCPDPINTPNAGGLLNFSLHNSNTIIRIYYHSALVDSAFYDLFVNTNSRHFLNFNHYDYQDACQGFKNQVLMGDTTLGNETLMLQPMGGTMVKLSFPHIRNLDGNDIAVQDAKLIFTVNTDDISFGVPSNFELVKQSPEGKMLLISDYTVGVDYYNGQMNTSKNTFYFRINRHLQDMINGKTDNNDLYLHVRNSNTTPGRAVIYGANPLDPNNRIKLQITYTTID